MSPYSMEYKSKSHSQNRRVQYQWSKHKCWVYVPLSLSFLVSRQDRSFEQGLCQVEVGKQGNSHWFWLHRIQIQTSLISRFSKAVECLLQIFSPDRLLRILWFLISRIFFKFVMLVRKIDLLISGSGQFSFKVFDFTRFFQIAALQISQTRYFIIKLHKFLELFT